MTELINTLERILQDIHNAEKLAKQITYVSEYNRINGRLLMANWDINDALAVAKWVQEYNRKEKEQECNCNRPYEIELTNEEWRKTCSAEDFAYWLADVCAWAMEEFRCGNTEKTNIAYWEKWLKQPHKPISLGQEIGCEVTTKCSQLGVNMQKAIRKGLLPCPHCGGKAGLWQAYDSSWCVQCDRCGASTMRFDKDEAVKRWNRRVKHDNQRTKCT